MVYTKTSTSRPSLFETQDRSNTLTSLSSIVIVSVENCNERKTKGDLTMTNMVHSERSSRSNMKANFVCLMQSLFFLGSGVLSLEEQEGNINNSSISRKRVGANNAFPKENIDTGREYLETLWDSVETNHDSKMEPGRLRYLESMMSMAMITPSGTPDKKPTPNSRPTIPGPTLPTIIPIPTKAPVSPPSQSIPVPFPTIPNEPIPPRTYPPTRLCSIEHKELSLLGALTTVTDRSMLLDPTTPQGKAYSFLLEEEPSYVCSSTVVQRFGLATLYFETNGAFWTHSSGWLGTGPECNWYGVECSDGFFATNLELAVNNLNGGIPNEISAMSTLQKVDFFSNSITGSLPGGFSRLSNLIALDLQHNLLTGDPFPFAITGMEHLISYRITNNKFDGSVPSRISSLRNLKELWVGNNMITGSIPSDIGDLRNLKTLYMNDNVLGDILPSELGLIPLDVLVMNNNQFLGSIPTQLFNVASLNTIRLDNNFFDGTLPNSIGQLTDLETLRVEKNDLSGPIPKSIGSMTSLVNLRLNANDWTGTIPDVFADYRQLDFFDVSDTLLEGTIPKSLFAVSSLRLAYMSNCNLSGRIPSQFADAPQLRDLYLNGNELTGSIPAIKPGQLENLSEFLLQNTKIKGSVPESICNLRSEFILDDLWTDCGGPSPEVVCDFPSCCNRCFESESITPSRR